MQLRNPYANICCCVTDLQVPVEVTDADEAAEAEAHQQSPKQLPHRYQLRGGPASASPTAPISRVLSGTRSGGSMVGRHTSKRHHRTADDRRWVFGFVDGKPRRTRTLPDGCSWCCLACVMQQCLFARSEWQHCVSATSTDRRRPPCQHQFQQLISVHTFTCCMVVFCCRQASLRMASTSRADPLMAAAAAAALESQGHTHGHHHPHLHAVAKHILHHGHHHHHGPEHATITVSAGGTAEKQEQQSAADSADGSKGSAFASLDGQSKTAAAILGDSGLAVAGVAKPEGKAEATSTAIVPAGWPASGECGLQFVIAPPVVHCSCT